MPNERMATGFVVADICSMWARVFLVAVGGEVGEEDEKFVIRCQNVLVFARKQEASPRESLTRSHSSSLWSMSRSDLEAERGHR